MFILVIFWIGVSYMIGKYAERRGHSFALAFLASVLLSPLLTFLVIALIPSGELVSGSQTITGGMLRECPYCAEPVKIQAVNCPHCCKNIPQVIVQRVPYSKPAPAFSVMGISLILTLIFGFVGYLIYANEKQDSDGRVTTQTTSQPIA
jgi:hypothetical protein